MTAFLQRALTLALVPASFACLWVYANAKRAAAGGTHGTWMVAPGVTRTADPYAREPARYEALFARLHSAEAGGPAREKDAEDPEDADLPGTPRRVRAIEFTPDAAEATADAS